MIKINEVDFLALCVSAEANGGIGRDAREDGDGFPLCIHGHARDLVVDHVPWTPGEDYRDRTVVELTLSSRLVRGGLGANRNDRLFGSREYGRIPAETYFRRLHDRYGLTLTPANGP